MEKQVINHVNNFLSLYLRGYRKGLSTQNALLSLPEKWKETIDNKGFAGGVLMDLSMAFDTLNYELLIAKPHAYGFGKESLMLLLGYLSNRWQRTKTNTSISSKTELLQGVPQGSVLDPLLFNIYLNDLLFFLDCHVCNFADDTTPLICNKNFDFVLNELERNSNITIDCFQSNYTKMNSDKCHLLVAGHKFEQIWAKIGTDLIWESNSVKLLGITIDNHLKFVKHISLLCGKANRKLPALATFPTFHKKRTLIKAFFESQFRHCSLTRMFHSRKIIIKLICHMKELLG